jgi:hypothetical protein
MTKAHSRPSRRRGNPDASGGARGRPREFDRLFVEDCAVRFDATEHLAKTRGGSLDDGVAWTRVLLTWTECGQPRARTVALSIRSTAQRLGGARYWWLCPACQRRRRILLMETVDDPVAFCRRCLGAVYSSDYPGHHRRRELSASPTGGSLASHQQWQRDLAVLQAKRRRGVRRGRRVRERARRLSGRMSKEPIAVTSLVTEYERTMPPQFDGSTERE